MQGLEQGAAHAAGTCQHQGFAASPHCLHQCISSCSTCERRFKLLHHLRELILKLPYLVLFLQLGLINLIKLQCCRQEQHHRIATDSGKGHQGPSHGSLLPGSQQMQNIHPSSLAQSQVLSSKPHWIILPTSLWAFQSQS